MIDPREDLFEYWYSAPMGEPAHRVEGFHVERATPDDYPVLWDLVDHAFGVRRPRPLYEWLYRDNPTGPARCLKVVEDATGETVATAAHFPWPAALADRRISGSVNGDAAVHRRVRKRGIDRMRLEAWRTHPLRKQHVTVGWPNADSMRHTHQQGLAGMMAGPLRRVVLPLDVSVDLRTRVASAAGRLRALAGGASLRLEPVERFDERFEAVSARFMRTEGIWFPRDAAFLQWRYLAHPTREYRPLALLRGDELLGFCVLGLDGRRATLMELAAPHGGAETVRLLRHACDLAREAGCERVVFFASAGFGQWASLEAAGFVPWKSDKMLFLNRFGATDGAAENWSVTPAEDEVL